MTAGVRSQKERLFPAALDWRHTGWSQCFSTLDLKSGYWQVDLHPYNKEKTVFLTVQGLL
jgi:hypothetical protein